MITISHGLSADLAQERKITIHRDVRAPASDFWHNGKLNMGPAIFLAVTLSLLGWASIIGAGFLIAPLI